MIKTNHFCPGLMFYKVIILLIAFLIFPVFEKGRFIQAQETRNYTSYPQIINAIKHAEVYIDSVYS